MHGFLRDSAQLQRRDPERGDHPGSLSFHLRLEDRNDLNQLIFIHGSRDIENPIQQILLVDPVGIPVAKALLALSEARDAHDDICVIP